jgi:nucleoside-diphosphate-sugar epimerase
MNIMITGGAGFIGFHLAKSLSIDKNNNIYILDDLSRGKKDIDLVDLLENNKNIKLINIDLTEKSNLDIIDKVYFDNIYHLAAINGTKYFYEKPEEVLRVNILALMNILDWINSNNCGKFLFTSSSETYASTIESMSKYETLIPTKEDIPLSIGNVFNERFSYGGSKIIGELLTINFCKKKNIPFNIVRYHNIYGPRMGYEHVIPQFLTRIFKKENPFNIYGGEETRAFCFVDDGVKATKLVMDSKTINNQIINIGNSKEEISILKLLRKIFNITSYNEDIITNEAPKGSVKRRCPDIAKIKNATGYTPTISLDTGLDITYKWYLNDFLKNIV